MRRNIDRPARQRREAFLHSKNGRSIVRSSAFRRPAGDEDRINAELRTTKCFTALPTRAVRAVRKLRQAAGSRILGTAVLCCLASSAQAGMPMPLPTEIVQHLRLTESAHAGFQAISFFLVVLLLSVVVVRWLWNGLAREFPKLPRLTFGKSLGLVVLWSLFFLVVLTMIAVSRELMTPGAWEKEGLLYRVVERPEVPLNDKPSAYGEARLVPAAGGQILPLTTEEIRQRLQAKEEP